MVISCLSKFKQQLDTMQLFQWPSDAVPDQAVSFHAIHNKQKIFVEKAHWWWNWEKDPNNSSEPGLWDKASWADG